MSREGGYSEERVHEAQWRGETSELPPVAAPGSEVPDVDYRLPNQRDPFEQVDTGPRDESVVESALDVSRFEQAPDRPAAQEEVRDLGIVLDLSKLKTKKEAEDVSASIKEALTRFQNAATPEERHGAFADLKRARGEDDMRLAA